MQVNKSEKEIIDIIWLYSRYYGEIVETAFRLYNEGEYYAAVVVTLNVIELLVKSIREKDNDTIYNDIVDLRNKEIISNSEFDILNNIRALRNKMYHKDAYQWSFEDNDNIIYSFTDSETWKIVFENKLIIAIKILVNVITNKRLTN